MLTVVSLIATIVVRPESLNNYFNYPFTFVVPVGVVASLAGVWFLNQQRAAGEGVPLLVPVSVLHAGRGVLGALSNAAAGNHGRGPNDITLSRALSGPHTLAVGLVWWIFGMALAVGYVVFVYSKFRGKVDLVPGRH